MPIRSTSDEVVDPAPEIKGFRKRVCALGWSHLPFLANPVGTRRADVPLPMPLPTPRSAPLAWVIVALSLPPALPLLLPLGCVGSSPQPTTPTTEAVPVVSEHIAPRPLWLVPEPQEPPPPPVEVTAQGATRPGEETCRKLGWTETCEPDLPGKKVDDVGRTAFFTSRGVQRPRSGPGSRGGSCFQAALKEGEDALFCRIGLTEVQRGKINGTAPQRLVERIVGYAVRDQQVVKILDAPFSVLIVDTQDMDSPPLFELSLVTTPDGKAVVREPADGACERARAHNAEDRSNAGSDPFLRGWALFDGALLERLCRAAGKPVGVARSPG